MHTKNVSKTCCSTLTCITIIFFGLIGTINRMSSLWITFISQTSTLIIQMGHHHESPLTGVIELRPDHWSTTLRYSKQPSNIYHAYTFHVNFHNQPLLYSRSNSYQHIILHSWIWNFISYQNHATFITNHFMFITCQELSKFLNYNSYTLPLMHIHSPHAII